MAVIPSPWICAVSVLEGALRSTVRHTQPGLLPAPVCPPFSSTMSRGGMEIQPTCPAGLSLFCHAHGRQKLLRVAKNGLKKSIFRCRELPNKKYEDLRCNFNNIFKIQNKREISTKSMPHDDDIYFSDIHFYWT